MKVLVTGATSLVGRLTAEALAEAGHQVTVFQRGASDLALREVRGDLADVSDVNRAVVGQDAVVHLAAKVGVVGSWAAFERVNVGGTRLLLSAAQRAGVSRFVHISSPSVGHSGTALVGAGADPADPAKTRGHYSTSKAMAELIALEHSSEAMPVVVLRPHLIWGPGDAQLVGRIVDRAKAARLALIGSGWALIDSTYVTNAVDAIVATVNECPSLGGHVFVVSNGQPRTVTELLGRIVDAAGLTPPTRHVPRRIAFGVGLLLENTWAAVRAKSDPPMTSFLAEQLSTAHWFDQRATQEALKWVPRVSLEEGFLELKRSFGPGLST